MALHPLQDGTLSFSGHESFALRYGWLKKGYDAVVLQNEPRAFSQEDALVTLGVGKNMVSSIRHWCLAAGVLEEEDGSRGQELKPTCEGNALLSDDGLDPYLEDTGTAWWIHWRLATHASKCASWVWLFNRPRGGRFSKQQLVDELLELAATAGGRASKASISRDVDVLIRSYAGTTGKKVKSLEDELDSPLAALRLLRPGLESGVFELVVGHHPTLPSWVFEAATREFCAEAAAAGRPIPLDDLCFAPRSPGRVFRLHSDAVTDRLLDWARRDRAVQIVDTAGLRQLYLPATEDDAADIMVAETARRRLDEAA